MVQEEILTSLKIMEVSHVGNSLETRTLPHRSFKVVSHPKLVFLLEEDLLILNRYITTRTGKVEMDISRLITAVSSPKF